jgi:hypothetical protein
VAADTKYGVITVEKDNPNHPLGSEEPVFLFRGDDMFTEQVLAFYLNLCKSMGCTEEHIQGIEAEQQRFADWTNRDDVHVKKPD